MECGPFFLIGYISLRYCCCCCFNNFLHFPRATKINHSLCHLLIKYNIHTFCLQFELILWSVISSNVIQSWQFHTLIPVTMANIIKKVFGKSLQLKINKTNLKKEFFFYWRLFLFKKFSHVERNNYPLINPSLAYTPPSKTTLYQSFFFSRYLYYYHLFYSLLIKVIFF